MVRMQKQAYSVRRSAFSVQGTGILRAEEQVGLSILSVEKNFHMGWREGAWDSATMAAAILLEKWRRSMADVVANQKTILANQKSILANQKAILANQADIKKNQKALAEILTNQKEILANQKAILGAVQK
jgi:hypothetical protein